MKKLLFLVDADKVEFAYVEMRIFEQEAEVDIESLTKTLHFALARSEQHSLHKAERKLLQERFAIFVAKCGRVWTKATKKTQL